jgi:hypothetical protein
MMKSFAITWPPHSLAAFARRIRSPHSLPDPAPFCQAVALKIEGCFSLPSRARLFHFLNQKSAPLLSEFSHDFFLDFS